jgi:hypothetical protein
VGFLRSQAQYSHVVKGLRPLTGRNEGYEGRTDETNSPKSEATEGYRSVREPAAIRGGDGNPGERRGRKPLIDRTRGPSITGKRRGRRRLHEGEPSSHRSAHADASSTFYRL